MTITIPDQVLTESKLNAADIRIELGIYLYEKQRLSIGKARKIAGLGLLDFQKELVQRNIYLHLDKDDLAVELKNLNLLKC